MKRVLFLIILILSVLTVNAQNHSNVWYFGSYAGLDFNSGSPVALTNSAMNNLEGCASISDSLGSILFYTNGSTVYDKNHAVMLNGTGLMGHFSSTQSAIIIPKPGSTTRYYIFTVDAYGQSNGLRYSEVDLTLNGGAGAVTNLKNIPLATSVSEKVAAVLHANQQDIWVVTKDFNSTNFLAFMVTPSGVNTTPVMSSAGSVHNSNMWNSQGYMKFSPDGSKLALAIDFGNYAELHDFNTATGIVFNTITFTNVTRCYGVEFSPDNSKLYLSSYVSNCGIYQYDLNAGSAAAIVNSRDTIFYQSGTYLTCALQLGPDGKIYVARDNSSFLGVINNPNAVGSTCNYVQNGVSLNGKTSELGLPTFMNYYSYSTNVAAVNTCIGDSTLFTITDTIDIDSVSWDFGDPVTGVNNYSNALSPYHIFSGSGSFSVQLIAYYPSTSDTITINIDIIGAPTADVGNDTVICSGQTILLDATDPIATDYLWQDNSTAATFVANIPGTYFVKVSNECGADTDTILLDTLPLPYADLGEDIAVCAPDTITLSAAFPDAQYLWHNGTTDSSITLTSSANVTVSVSNQCGTATSFVNVIIQPPPNINFPGIDSICPTEPEYLSAPGSFSGEYLWSTGATSESILIMEPGQYWLEITDNIGCKGSDTITFIEYCPSPVLIGNAFSPNNDGRNDVFEPFSENAIDYQLKIFNRWGSMIYDGNNQGWDGRNNGNDCEIGNYLFVLEYSSGSGKRKMKKGNVILLR